MAVAPTNGWPVWTPPLLSDGEPVGSYGGIARYVVPHVLQEHFERVFPRGLRRAHTRAGRSRRDEDRAILEDLWAALVRQDVNYAGPVWSTGAGQRIAPPWWILRPQASATCIDLAVLFAGACLNEDLDASLVMLQGSAVGHAGVAVRLGAAPGAGTPTDGTSAPDDAASGVRCIDAPERFARDRNVILLDVTVAAAGPHPKELAHAHDELVAALRNPGFADRHAVNVTVRQQAGDPALPHQPAVVGALRTRLPQLDAPVHPFPAHANIPAALRDARRPVVLHGPPGAGKSTLAQEAALAFDHGFGWFLNGQDKTSLESSLAERHLQERGDHGSDLDANVRKDLAREALHRLADNQGSWVVWLDNADAGLEDLRALLPDPAEHQRLIITSTAPAEAFNGFNVDLVPVPTVPDDEMTPAATVRGIPTRLIAMLQGLPLLLTAVAKLAVNDEQSLETLESLVQAGHTGATAYWLAVKQAFPEALEFARSAAWLPPDHIDPDCVTGAHHQAALRLVDAGLLHPTPHGTYRMHRLLGQAIRNDTGARSRQTAESLLRNEPAVTLLLQHADSRTLTALRDAMKGSASGRALRGLAVIEEKFGVAASTETFAKAQALLDPSDPADRPALADCLHGAARAINVGLKKPDRDGISEAIHDLRTAESLRDPGDAVNIARHQALRALLEQRAAKGIKRGSPELVESLLTIMATLDSSYQRRLDALGANHPLVDRALFNRAGVRIRLAQEQPSQRQDLLNETERVYRATAAFRRVFFTDPNVYTASAVAGIATWGYYAILYGLAPDPVAVYQEAVAAAQECLAWRMQLGDRKDIGKSAAILAKLGLLKLQQADPEESPGVLAEAVVELEIHRDDIDKAIGAGWLDPPT